MVIVGSLPLAPAGLLVAILMSGGWQSLQLLATEASVDWVGLVLGVLASAVFAFLALDWFLKFVTRFSMLSFAIYRVLLGGVIVYVLA